MTQHGIVKGDEQLKLSSMGFIIGAILIIVGNIWVTTIGLGNPMEALDKYSENVQVLQIVALVITFGYWAAMIGVIALQDSISAAGAIWARLGLYFMIMGGTLWTLGMSLDITYSNLIANWLAASAGGEEFARNLITIYSPTNGIGRGIFPMNVMSNWMAFGFLGIGMVRSSIYPRWLGWFGILLGIIGLPLGALMAITGREAVWVFFTVLSFMTILWFLTLGIWMARKAW